MRSILILAILSTGAALAQNSDLALLAGVSGIHGETAVAGQTTAASGALTAAFQANYAWQIVQRKADLYVELPLIIPVRLSGQSVHTPNVNITVANSSPDVFFAPGLRLKISPQSRVSFYGATNFGIASFAATSIILAGPTTVSTARQNSAAFGFGGGVDFRLTRLLSLRGEARDFVTRKGLGGVTGRNHLICEGGIAFHF